MTTLIAISRGSSGAFMFPRAFGKCLRISLVIGPNTTATSRGPKTTCLTSKALLRSQAASKKSRFFSGVKSRRFDERLPNAAVDMMDGAALVRRQTVISHTYIADADVCGKSFFSL